jgi:hypothetical protein
MRKPISIFLLAIFALVLNAASAFAQYDGGKVVVGKASTYGVGGGYTYVDTAAKAGYVLTSGTGNNAPTWKPMPQRIFFTGNGTDGRFYSMVPNGSTSSGSATDFTDTTATGYGLGAWCAPVAGTFKNLHLFGRAPQSTASVTISLVKITSVTTLTTTNTGPTKSSTDTTHTVTAAANDLFDIKCTTSGSPAFAGFTGWVEFYPN